MARGNTLRTAMRAILKSMEGEKLVCYGVHRYSFARDIIVPYIMDILRACNIQYKFLLSQHEIILELENGNHKIRFVTKEDHDHCTRGYEYDWVQDHMY